MDNNEDKKYFQGRGAQVNTHNRFLKQSYGNVFPEVIDEEMLKEEQTQYIEVFSKTIVNKVESPDIPGMYSMNPYQGCEHGCLYCYARSTHEYWGYSAGLDFERKILVKKNAPELLEKAFQKKNWVASPIMFSGNTDCYQPIERKLEITRKMLEVCLKYKHPVSMITKNALIVRDLDILSELAKLKLAHVMITITSLDENLRLKLEPRTVTCKNRMKAVKILADAGVPVGVMNAPIIPGLTSHEIPEMIKTAAENGAYTAGYTIVRLNGAIADVFKDWLHKNFPDRADKVWNHIKDCHGGQVNDSRFGTRTRGEGKIAESIRNLFKMSVKKYLKGKDKFEFDTEAFSKQRQITFLKEKVKGQISLFDDKTFTFVS
ncbi:MAG: PA0069 family radical SAM protein [Bacteroidetes bacterium]|nr:MAG: PA0069 family radical SAM protein [Bacteroidota bacterium]